MNKTTKRWVAAIILLCFIFFITASIVSIYVISDNEKKETTTEVTTTATITDATTEEKTEATTEEIKVPSAKVVLDNRKIDKPAPSNKTKFDAGLDYVIEKDAEKCTVRSTDKKESVKWYAAKANDTMYIVEDTYLRIVPNTKALGYDLFFGTKVKRIGISENGWDIISYKNKFYFVWYEDLIDENPAEVATTEATKTTVAPTTTEVTTTEAPATTEVIVDIVEATIESNMTAEAPVETTEVSTEEAVTEAPASTAAYNPWDLYVNPISYNGYSWTWYTEVLLPGEGLPIPGRYTDGDGFVCDENGYIVLAANLKQVARGTIMDTPFGRLGKVYDTGCNYNVIDVYTNWQPY